MRRVTGAIQHYAWGDRRFIPELLGVQPDDTPWAELWLGTHPNGPTVLDDGTPLVEHTGPLPYLMKVLSAAEPLSLQTHPNERQAADGFARGVFPDDHAKPELLYALTRFRALCGIRPIAETVEVLSDLDCDELLTWLSNRGVLETLKGLYGGELSTRSVVDRCARSPRAEAALVTDLAARYPEDPSVAATLLLNLVELSPGQALRLDAGNLHAYIEGSGIELMGPSDNVVRAGLTNKAVDADELFAVVDPAPLPDPIIDNSDRLTLDSAGVMLHVLGPATTHRAVGNELAIDLDGATWWYQPGDIVTATTTTFVAGPIPDSPMV